MSSTKATQSAAATTITAANRASMDADKLKDIVERLAPYTSENVVDPDANMLDYGIDQYDRGNPPFFFS